MEMQTEQKCHDCDASPGQLHEPGCDVERCPYCGRQLIGCACREDEKKEAWIEKHLLPWTGTWPGVAEAIEFGLYCRWEPNARLEAEAKRVGLVEALRTIGGPAGRWVVCDKDDPEARPDLNRMVGISRWDREVKRFVKMS
jgi:hypothetical protein